MRGRYDREFDISTFSVKGVDADNKPIKLYWLTLMELLTAAPTMAHVRNYRYLAKVIIRALSKNGDLPENVNKLIKEA
jgi:hypothetical protein